MDDIKSSLTPAPRKNPWIAFFLTLIFPGLGHLYVGERMAAFIYAAMGAGLGYIYFTSTTSLSRMLSLLIFPFVFVPVCRDVIAIARGKKKAVTGGESPLYVIWMLCCVGPFSLPLLWQNKKLPLVAKIILSIFVLVIFVGAIWAMKTVGQSYEQLLQGM